MSIKVLKGSNGSNTAKATANTANDMENDIKTVSLYSIKNAILDSLSVIGFSRNNTTTNNDTVRSLTTLLVNGKISQDEFEIRLTKIGKPTTTTGNFRGIISLNNERVSSKGILSESLLKGGKICCGNSPISLAVYKDSDHYDRICKLQDVFTLLLNIGTDTDIVFDKRDFEIALYKAIHVAQSKSQQYGISTTEDSEFEIVKRITFKKK